VTLLIGAQTIDCTAPPTILTTSLAGGSSLQLDEQRTDTQSIVLGTPYLNSHWSSVEVYAHGSQPGTNTRSRAFPNRATVHFAADCEKLRTIIQVRQPVPIPL